jgi:hypothetical protein
VPAVVANDGVQGEGVKVFCPLPLTEMETHQRVWWLRLSRPLCPFDFRSR